MTVDPKTQDRNWAQLREWRYPKGVVLSPNSRVTGGAQAIAVKGRHYWCQSQWMIHVEHQSSMWLGDTKSTQSGGLDEGESSEDNNGGEKQEVVWWDQIRECKKIFTTRAVLFWSSHRFILVSYLYPRFLIFTSIKIGLTWVDLVSPSNVELWCSSYHSLTLVSATSFLDRNHLCLTIVYIDIAIITVS